MEEASDRVDRGVGRVAKGRVAGALDHHALGVAGDAAPDIVELREAAVLVARALHEKQRTAKAGNIALDVPSPERGREPDVVPAPERGIDIGVIAREPGTKIGRFEQNPRSLDALDRQRLDEDVGRDRDHRFERR